VKPGCSSACNEAVSNGRAGGAQSWGQRNAYSLQIELSAASSVSIGVKSRNNAISQYGNIHRFGMNVPFSRGLWGKKSSQKRGFSREVVTILWLISFRLARFFAAPRRSAAEGSEWQQVKFLKCVQGFVQDRRRERRDTQAQMT
jgi:hypothetical protein